MKSTHLKSIISFIGLTTNLLMASPTYAQIDSQLFASGQWRDPTTNLIWMRCSIGQQWSGQTCVGEAKPMTGFDAQKFAAALKNGNGFAGYTNWRLPTPYELSMLRICSTGWQSGVSHQVADIDGSIRNVVGQPEMIGLPPNNYVPIKCAENAKRPTLDAKIFPNTSLLKHSMWWTSETYGSYDILYVSFANGVIDKIGGAAWKGHLRLVRE